MVTATEARSTLAFRLAKLTFETTGESLTYSAGTLDASPIAEQQVFLEEVAEGKHPITDETKQKSLQMIDQLYRFLLEPLVGGGIRVTSEFENGYWGQLINSALARLFSLRELFLVKETTAYLNVPRSTIQYWQELGILYVVYSAGKPYYIQEQVKAMAKARAKQQESQPYKRPGRRARQQVAS